MPLDLHGATRVDAMKGSGEVILKADNLTLGYGGHTVLRNVYLEVHSREFWFLVGPNGEGKSTFLRAVLGLLLPKGGVLWTHPYQADPQRIGFVPQNCDINPTLPTTVREFVSLGLAGIRCAREERRRRTEEALERVGLGGMASRDYWALSGGQRQRVLVARALVRQPSLLILDEATNGMDLSTEEAFLRCLDKLHQRDGLTILFVTHNLGIAMRHGTHAAVFKGGRVIAGIIQETLRQEVLEEVYGVPIEVSLDEDRAVCIRVGT